MNWISLLSACLASFSGFMIVVYLRLRSMHGLLERPHGFQTHIVHGGHYREHAERRFRICQCCGHYEPVEPVWRDLEPAEPVLGLVESGDFFAAPTDTEQGA